MFEVQHNQSVGLHFHGVEKIKENDKNTKNRKPTKWAGKVWREKPRVGVQLGQNLKENYNFFKFQFEIALNGYLDKFLT